MKLCCSGEVETNPSPPSNDLMMNHSSQNSELTMSFAGCVCIVSYQRKEPFELRIRLSFEFEIFEFRFLKHVSRRTYRNRNSQFAMDNGQWTVNKASSTINIGRNAQCAIIVYCLLSLQIANCSNEDRGHEHPKELAVFPTFEKIQRTSTVDDDD